MTTTELATERQDTFALSNKVICRFSCGAASAVATKMAIEQFGTVEIYYNDTGSEHPDNVRFLADCEKWFGQEVKTLRSKAFKNVVEVIRERRYIVGFGGAPCTSELKRIPGESVWNFGDREVFGYTKGEEKRVDKFRRDNPERKIVTPLIEAGLTKRDCFDVVRNAGIKLPTMYFLGFRNNNCIGCVKARDSIDYWKRVRKYFPAVFAEMAEIERELDFAINRVTKDGIKAPMFLDAIEPGDPKGADPQISCGFVCETVEAI